MRTVLAHDEGKYPSAATGGSNKRKRDVEPTVGVPIESPVGGTGEEGQEERRPQEVIGETPVVSRES